MIGRAALPIFCLLSALAGAVQIADPVAQSAAAKQAMAAGDFAKAAEIYRKLVNEIPANAGLRFDLGMALHYKGDYAASVEQLQAALKLDSHLAPAKFFLGLSYVKLHRAEMALPFLREAAAAEPANTTIQVEFADALLATDHLDEAAGAFTHVLDLDQTEARAWQGLGLSYAGLSQRSFHILETKAPESPYLTLLLAESDVRQAKYRSAYARYRSALVTGVALREIHSGLADVYRKTQHPDWAAIEEQREREAPGSNCRQTPEMCAYVSGKYSEAISSGSTSPEAFYAKARSYEQLTLQALGHLSQMPQTPQIHELMAEASRVRGNNHEAAEELKQALQLDPASSRLQALYADALWRDHNYDAAQPLLEALVRADPNSVELTFELGDTFLQQDEAEKAIPLLAKAVDMHADLLPAQASLGKAYMQMASPARAIPYLKAALPADADGSIYFRLAEAYERTGQQLLAKRTRERFAAITERRMAAQARSMDAEIAAP